MALLKKSDLIGCSDEDYLRAFDSIKNSLLNKKLDEIEFVKTVGNLIDMYRNTPSYVPTIYILGEFLGKMEIGGEIMEKTELVLKNIENQIKSQSNAVDSLLNNYKSKRVVN